ncbi:MAG: DUF669 domain-containing protein [Firmicutes bacterium HGW-Firmicutes-16]|nr:MAG: DUF669 domain-containing protein [Firmicutes bacterium HGW-Firmicutes-16]
MAENNTTGYELEWESAIEHDSEYVLLPAGDYDFTVTNFERGRHAGSDKLPPCKKAVLALELDSEAGSTTLKHNLFLHSSTEGLLCAFFVSIGQRKHGERLTMNWSTVIGSKGRCKVGVRTYKNKDNEDVTINEIKKFYEPDPNAPTSAAAASQTYEAGRF